MVKQATTFLNNGIEMPLLGLGVYDMYHQEAENAVGNALEIGYRLIDTAAMYENEVEIGNAIRNSAVPRKDIFLTTKVANDGHGYDNALRAFEVSSQKLNADYIDLYLVHWPLKNLRKDTWKAFERLYEEKRVRAIGVANYLLPFLHELAEYATVIPTVNQVEFTPYLFSEELLQACQKRNIILQAYSPLVRGKRFDDKKLIEIAEKYEKTPAQIILRWAIQLGVSTIPKSVKIERLKENFDVFDFQLSEQDMAKLCTFNENFRICENPLDML